MNGFCTNEGSPSRSQFPQRLPPFPPTISHFPVPLFRKALHRPHRSLSLTSCIAFCNFRYAKCGTLSGQQANYELWRRRRCCSYTSNININGSSSNTNLQLKQLQLAKGSTHSCIATENRKLKTENRKRNKRNTLEGAREQRATNRQRVHGQWQIKKYSIPKQEKSKPANEEKQFCTPNERKLQPGSGNADK